MQSHTRPAGTSCGLVSSASRPHRCPIFRPIYLHLRESAKARPTQPYRQNNALLAIWFEPVTASPPLNH